MSGENDKVEVSVDPSGDSVDVQISLKMLDIIADAMERQTKSVEGLRNDMNTQMSDVTQRFDDVLDLVPDSQTVSLLTKLITFSMVIQMILVLSIAGVGVAAKFGVLEINASPPAIVETVSGE